VKLIGLLPCRNEDWVIGLSARAALMWVDELIILDHASTDRTPDILRELFYEYRGRVFTVAQSDPTWREMAHRQYLLDIARQQNATHIAIVDADEVLSGNLLNSIRPAIERLRDGKLMQLPWTCLSQGTGRYFSSGVWGTNWVTMAFADHPNYGWAARDGYDFHHRHPVGSNSTLNVERRGSQGAGGLMHLQFSSRRRLRAKQALYKITEVLRWRHKFTDEQINAKYNLAVYESDPLTTPTAEVPAEWWEPYESLMHRLDVHAEPWQERAVRDAIAEHGRDKFAGLDLFGVA